MAENGSQDEISCLSSRCLAGAILISGSFIEHTLVALFLFHCTFYLPGIESPYAVYFRKIIVAYTVNSL